MKLDKIAKYIIEAGKKADSNLSNSFKVFLQLAEDELKSKAPVDKGDFKKSWEIYDTNYSQFGMSAKLGNDRPYAAAIEFGSVPGQNPWPNPGEKTTLSSGRIFSTQAVGGTIDTVFSERKIIAFAETLATSISKAFR